MVLSPPSAGQQAGGPGSFFYVRVLRNLHQETPVFVLKPSDDWMRSTWVLDIVKPAGLSQNRGFLWPGREGTQPWPSPPSPRPPWGRAGGGSCAAPRAPHVAGPWPRNPPAGDGRACPSEQLINGPAAAAPGTSSETGKKRESWDEEESERRECVERAWSQADQDRRRDTGLILSSLNATPSISVRFLVSSFPEGNK